MSHSHKPNQELRRYLMAMSGGRLSMDKPGYLTSEFWLTLACIVCVTTLVGIGRITVNQVLDLWPILSVAVGYSVSRGLAKRGSNNSGNTN